MFIGFPIKSELKTATIDISDGCKYIDKCQ